MDDVDKVDDMDKADKADKVDDVVARNNRHAAQLKIREVLLHDATQVPGGPTLNVLARRVVDALEEYFHAAFATADTDTGGISFEEWWVGHE